MRKQDRSTIDTGVWRNGLRQFVAKRAGYRCQHCGVFTGMHGQADHVIPRADCAATGISPTDPANLQWLCAPCHSRKTNSERWRGHVKVDRSKPRRAKVRGRDAYFSAIHQLGANVCTAENPHSTTPERN